jgi:hypothetical protein
VILDRSPESLERFATRNFRRKSLQRTDRVTVWKLLELQRHAMLMYTSCGWFFDELSGIETVQVIAYAGRVVQLAQELFGDALEQRFLEKLALAKSNIPENADGAVIYNKFVKTAMVDLQTLGAHYAISTLFEEYGETTQIYCYSVENKDYRMKRSGKSRLAFGKARFTSGITQDSEILMFGVIHFGDHNVHGGVATFTGDDAYRDLAKSVREAFASSDIPATIHLIDRGFGGHTYSLKNLFRDEQRKVLQEILKPTLEANEATFRELYENQSALLHFMRDLNIPIPKAIRSTAELGLNGMLRGVLQADELNLDHIQSLLDDIRVADAPLDVEGLEMTLRRNLERSSWKFFENPTDLEGLRKFRQQVVAARSLPFPLVLWSMQNLCYAVLQKVYPHMRENGESEWISEFEQLATALGLKITVET